MTGQDLKNSILQLAIQGKLVEQREEEGTAKELLEKIEAEKKQLIKEGKIKKQKALPEIKEDEIPFVIPESWEWVRLGDCCVYAFSGKSPKYTKTPNNNIAIGQRNNQNYGMDFTYLKYCTDEFMENYNEEMYLKEYDILLNTLGGGTVGRTGLYNNPHGFKCITDGHIFVFRTGIITFQKYLYYVLKANQRKIEKDAEGSTNQSFLKLENVKSYLIPLPPLEEQKRIVAKIEELMPYVDKYDVAYSEVKELNKKFPEDMQKSILQYAIQGKLVEQREEDGTAEDLYKQIQEEKKKLIKEGKIKKTKTLPEITEDEIPFDIPENWKWVRLGDALDIARGGSPRPIKSFITDSEDGVNWIKIGDTDKGGKYINSTNEKIIKEGVKKSRFVKKGDFLLSNSMSFGRPYILNIDGCIHDGWLVLSQRVEVFNKDFLYYLLSSRMVFNQFQSVVSGAVVNNLNSDKVRLTIVPIPPLTEQKRIVEKIEELLPYTNQLVKKVD